jgi:pimeloyl-ACP methyl ester carboxylesterase
MWLRSPAIADFGFAVLHEILNDIISATWRAYMVFAIIAYKDPLPPILAMRPRAGFITNIEMAKEMAEQIPNARMEILEESGHYGFAEEPEKFYRVVKEFVYG